MATTKRTLDELAALGGAIFDRQVRPALRPEDDGKFVAVDIETGDVRQPGKKAAWLDGLGELWDNSQYEESFDLDGFLTAVGIGHCDLLGHSLAGAIGVEPYLITLAEDAAPYTQFRHAGVEFLPRARPRAALGRSLHPRRARSRRPRSDPRAPSRALLG